MKQETLSKKKIITELQRRIDFIAQAYDFDVNTKRLDVIKRGGHIAYDYGQYRALIRLKRQIKECCFIDGLEI